MIGLLAISILGIAIAGLLGSLGGANGAIFLFSLGFYLYVARSKSQAREMLGKDFDATLNLAILKRVTWAKVERGLGRIATVIILVSAVLSAYFAYESVQLVLNPATTVLLGSGKFTVGNSSAVFPVYYTTPPYVISAYRYAIVHPYYTADTRLGYPNRYLFGPVYTDVIVDGKTTRIFFAQTSRGPFPIITALPNNLTTVSGLSLVTTTYCVGNCTIADATVYVQADLIR
jgi:hypothetical protein